jgi:outer membrane protein OmpA-like peptidoglycan-associated protein
MSDMKKLNLIILLVSLGLWGATNSFAQPDSLVTFTGTLVNYRTGNALPNMKVSYKKLPYESEMGNFTTDSDGKFTAYFRAKEQYSLLIENEGYIKLSEIINPLEGASTDLNVERTFSLNEGGVGSVMKLDHLSFGLGEAIILADSHEELDRLAQMLDNTPDMYVRLEGHTDYVGNPTANINLSQMRVDAVKEYLTGKGINPNRLETKAFGGSQPLVRSSSSSERSPNRRVEVRIISEGK